MGQILWAMSKFILLKLFYKGYMEIVYLLKSMPEKPQEVF